MTNNKGNVLIISLVISAFALAIAGYYYSTNYLEGLQKSENPKEVSSQVSLNETSMDVDENWDKDVLQGATPNPDYPNRYYGAKKVKDDSKSDIFDFYFYYSASTPKARAELVKIIANHRKGPFVYGTLCPLNSRCVASNGREIFLNQARTQIIEICRGEAVLVIVRGVERLKGVPNGSEFFTGFLNEQFLFFNRMPSGDTPLLNCSLRGRSARSATGEPGVINGIDFNTLDKSIDVRN